MSFLRLSLPVILLLFARLGALAQTGTIQGTLTDQQGAVIANAKITAVDEAKQLVVRETVSGGDGHFYLRNLLPSTYTMKSEVTDISGRAALS